MAPPSPLFPSPPFRGSAPKAAAAGPAAGGGRGPHGAVAAGAPSGGGARPCPPSQTKAAAPVSRPVAIPGRGRTAAIAPEGRNGQNYTRLWEIKLAGAVAVERYYSGGAWRARRPAFSCWKFRNSVMCVMFHAAYSVLCCTISLWQYKVFANRSFTFISFPKLLYCLHSF